MAYGKFFWLPLVFGALLGMLFLPMIRFFRRWRLPDWIAIGLCVLVLVLIFGVLVGVVTYQVNAVAQQWPQVQAELAEKGEALRQMAIDDLGLSAQRVDAILAQARQGQKSLQGIIGNVLGSFFSSTTNVLLTLVYMVFLLLTRQRIKQFILKLLPKKQVETGRSVIAASLQVTFNYLGGRLILTTILGTIYAIGFLLFGLPNAIPLAVLAGALSIIPYLGNIIGAAIAIAFGIATGEGFTALLGVIGTMAVAQVLENNVLQPWIIGSQVNMNPLFTFASIIAFGLIWGVPGTIVAIPLVSIVKQVFHHVPGLHPLAYVMDFEE